MADAWTELVPALQRLDRLLEQAVAAAKTVYGAEAAEDRFRGLYIHQSQAVHMVSQQPGQPLFRRTQPSTGDVPSAPLTTTPTEAKAAAPGRRFGFVGRLFRAEEDTAASPQVNTPVHPLTPPPDQAAEGDTTETAEAATDDTAVPPGHDPVFPSEQPGTRLAWLQTTFNLTPFELDVIVIALAPALDRRYERLYAYLQDNVSWRRPGVELILNLLCQTAADKLLRRVHFSPDAPLLAHHLVHLIPEQDSDKPSLLSHYVKLDEQIVNFLLGQETIDARLAPFSKLMTPTITVDSLWLPQHLRESLADLVNDAWEAERPLRIYLQGPEGNGRHTVVAALAAEADASLLIVDLAQAVAQAQAHDPSCNCLPTLLFREAWFHNALLLLDGIDKLNDETHAAMRQKLLITLSNYHGIVFLTGSAAWQPSSQTAVGVITLPIDSPDYVQRRQAWHSALAAAGLQLSEPDLNTLAGRYHLTLTQITDATNMALQHAQWRQAGAPQTPNRPTLEELFTAVRAQNGHELARLARKVEPLYQWDDIILPEDTFAQLREMVQRVEQRHQVLHEWAFDRKLARGKGVNALFAGPSGTGKTMAAEIIANALALDLYRIDLSGVVSKYIGETEKNLDRIFAAAENANAILFFDEADALFGKRSEVRDSHDRYANIEISYLLQKMEEYNGVAILATNLRQNLDDAFIRRLTFTIHFPFPDGESRHHIWKGIWPDTKRLLPEVDLGFLAQTFRLSGGNIRNVALAAAFLAAQDEDDITMNHLFHAIRREYQKMGKTITEDELADFRARLPIINVDAAPTPAANGVR